MGVIGVVRCLVLGFFLFFLSSGQADSTSDPNACSLWLEYFSLQEMAQRREVRRLPLSLRTQARLRELSHLLFTDREARPISEDSLPFEMTAWDPDEVGEWTPTSEETSSPEEDAAKIEAKHYAWEVQLAELRAWASDDAVEAVHRRMLAHLLLNVRELRIYFERTAVDPSIQELLIEVWASQDGWDRPHIPDPQELSPFAEVLSLPTEVALAKLRELDFNRPYTGSDSTAKSLYQIVRGLAGPQLHRAPQITVELMMRFSRNNHHYPTPTFGKFLHYFLGLNDELYVIHDQQTLQQYLDSH